MAPSSACSGSTAADAISPATRPARSRRTQTHSTNGNAASSANGDDRPAAAITAALDSMARPSKAISAIRALPDAASKIAASQPAPMSARPAPRSPRRRSDRQGPGREQPPSASGTNRPQRPACADAPAPAHRSPNGEPAGRRLLPDWQANHGIWRQVYSTQRTRTCAALRIGFWLTPKLASSV